MYSRLCKTSLLYDYILLYSCVYSHTYHYFWTDVKYRLLQIAIGAKYNQATFWALEPMTDKTFCGCWLNRSKQFWATSSSTCLVSKSSQWVTSRRKCLHNISMGLSHGLYVGK